MVGDISGRGEEIVEGAMGGLGAGRFGVRLVIGGGGGEVGDVMADAERGMGGGALGFSKLSSPLRGNRGLAGGLIIGGIAA